MDFEPINLKKKASVLILYNAFGAIFGYITIFFVYRFVGQTAWGIVGSATAIIGIISVVADLGVSSTHIKKLSEYKDKFEECLGAYTIMKLIFTNLFFVTALLLIFVLNNFFGIKFESEHLRHATILIIFYYYIDSISQIFRYTLFSLMKTNQAILSDFVKTTVQNSLIIGVVIYWIKNPMCSREFLGVIFTYTYVIGAFTGLLSLLYYCRKYKFKYPSKKIFKEYKTYTLSLTLFGIVNTIIMYTDRAMIQVFWDSYEVGGYFGVQKIAQAITFIGTSVMWIVYPAQSYHFLREKEKFVRVTFKTEKYISMLSVVFVLFGIVFATEILNIWNVSLTNYSLQFIILLVYSYMYSISLPYLSLLVSIGKPTETLKVGLIQASLNLILNVVLIPASILGVKLFGLKSLGAALSTSISYLVGFVYLKWSIKKNAEIKFNISILKHVVSSSIAILPLLVAKYVYQFDRIYEIVIAFLAYLALYASFLMLLKEIKLREIISEGLALFKS